MSNKKNNLKKTNLKTKSIRKYKKGNKGKFSQKKNNKRKSYHKIKEGGMFSPQL